MRGGRSPRRRARHDRKGLCGAEGGRPRRGEGATGLRQGAHCPIQVSACGRVPGVAAAHRIRQAAALQAAPAGGRRLIQFLAETHSMFDGPDDKDKDKDKKTEPPKSPPEPPPPPKRFVTKHGGTFNGRKLAYTATAAETHMKDAAGK